MDVVFVDFETRSTVDLKKCGADVYARHPSTDILCFAYAWGDDAVDLCTRENAQDRMYDMFNAYNDGFPFVAHNAAFELAIWNYVMVPRYGWPPLKPEQVICTMAMAYAMALPGALENAAPAAGIQHQKDMAGHRVMLQLSQPRSVEPSGEPRWYTPEEFPEKFEKLYAYCKQDIEVERELYKRLLPLSESERQLWILDQKINQRGVQVDLPAVKQAIEIVKAETLRLNAEIRKVTNNAVATCTAHQQLKDWLAYRGVATDSVAKGDVVDLLTMPDLPADCRAALLLRQEAAKTSTAKVEAMLNGACDDGRLRGMFQYHAASTGRWGGRRVQLQNLPRNKLKQSEIDQVFEVLS